jgi:hypothetical protein
MGTLRNSSPVGWYVATYVLRFIELAEPGNEDPEKKFLTWENTILVRAADLDEAYDKTVNVAVEGTAPYKGWPAPGADVQWVFEGVLDILPVYEEIEDGAEILWAERRRKLASIRKSVRGRGEFRQ